MRTRMYAGAVEIDLLGAGRNDVKACLCDLLLKNSLSVEELGCVEQISLVGMGMLWERGWWWMKLGTGEQSPCEELGKTY